MLSTRFFTALLCPLALAGAFACSTGPRITMTPISPPPPPQPIVGEPHFAVHRFDVMAQAIQKPALPWLRAADNADNAADAEVPPCFATRTASETWITDNPMIKANITHRANDIQERILDWLIATPLKNRDKASAMRTLQITLDDLTVVHADHGALRLQHPASCIDDDTRMPRHDQRIITTAFGAKTLIFRNEIPLDKTLLNAIKAFAKRGRYTYRATPTYPKALDDNGRPMRKKNAWLHVAPDGELVPAREVPPPARRPVFEFTLTFDDALYFADGDLPPTTWSLENTPERCHIHLIFDDIVPRAPECTELKDAGFGVARSDTPEHLVVKISAGNSIAQATVPWNTPSRIETGGQVVAWVTARPMEEGAILEVDSLVLHPSEAPVHDFILFKFNK